MQNNNKKICIVASSLGKGGAELSSATLSFILSNLGFEVHIVTVLPAIDYSYVGTLYNLGELKQKNDSLMGRIQRLYKFKAYLKQHKFLCIIDNRTRIQAYRELIVSKYIYKNTPVVYVLHNYNSKKTFTPFKWLNIWLYKNEIMTAVSEDAKLKFEKLFKLNNIRTIYNAFNFEAIETKAKATSKAELGFERFILFYGRLDDEHKNLKLLLSAYKLSKLPEENIKLLILGDGPDDKTLVDYSKDLRIDVNVCFQGYTNNPYPYVKHALFVMLTSRYEGFPMIIPESLSLRTPVISVDCQSGPKEVIQNGYNGLLVENYNSKALAEAMNSFIFDTALYNQCKENTKQSVDKFSIENIAQDWLHLIEEIHE